MKKLQIFFNIIVILVMLFTFISCGITDSSQKETRVTFMIRTTDKGASWSSIESGTYFGMLGLEFYDDSVGVAVGFEGSILRTGDQGAHWTNVESPVSDDLYSVCFIGNSIGVIGGNDGTFLRTADTGLSWIEIIVPSAAGNYVFDISFFDNNIGVAVGSNGLLMRTSNGGISWTRIQSETVNDLWKVCCLNDGLAYVIVGNENYVLKSADYGESWVLDNLLGDSGACLMSISFPSDNIGYLGGDGFIYKTTDKGGSWTRHELPNGFIAFQEFFVDDTLGFCSDLSQTTIRTKDGGDSWENVFDDFREHDWDVFGLYFIDENIGMITVAELW